MKNFVIILIVCCFYKFGISQEIIKGNFKITAIDSIDYYYTICIQDSIKMEMLILSEKLDKDSTICEGNKLKVDEWYHLILKEQFSILANKEKDIYIDLFYIDYYSGEKFIAGKNRIPYFSPNIESLIYCKFEK